MARRGHAPRLARNDPIRRRAAGRPRPIVKRMRKGLRLMLVAAHPDDETLGFGGVLARYAGEGVETSLVTATRGERGRFQAHRFGDPGHPGAAALARIREAELAGAAAALGIGRVRLLDYGDQHLDQADVRDAV